MTCCTRKRNENDKFKPKVYDRDCKSSVSCTKRKRKQGHLVDALALGGDEGRDKLRKAAVRRK